jgi:16S rRNA (guanine966-N2)-methyltransferase
MFGILTSMDVIDGAAVVDLFAGSGALGIEALSRGAASAVFVERDREATETIRANLALLGDDAASGRVVAGDALAWARATARSTRLDLVFADPPYAWAEWGALLGALAPVADVLVAETGGDLEPGDEWETVRQRRYGSTVVTVLRPQAAPGPALVPGVQPVHAQQRGGI